MKVSGSSNVYLPENKSTQVTEIKATGSEKSLQEDTLTLTTQASGYGTQGTIGSLPPLAVDESVSTQGGTISTPPPPR